MPTFSTRLVVRWKSRSTRARSARRRRTRRARAGSPPAGSSSSFSLSWLCSRAATSASRTSRSARRPRGTRPTCTGTTKRTSSSSSSRCNVRSCLARPRQCARVASQAAVVSRASYLLRLREAQERGRAPTGAESLREQCTLETHKCEGVSHKVSFPSPCPRPWRYTSSKTQFTLHAAGHRFLFALVVVWTTPNSRKPEPKPSLARAPAVSLLTGVEPRKQLTRTRGPRRAGRSSRDIPACSHPCRRPTP
mmetsp:Transcript_9978/g.41340  ORF Transcript_9978/g.41340 Transcript_9978/m.41340 type:complete len:250 (+) Transcript_9978:645-1394(+)